MTTLRDEDIVTSPTATLPGGEDIGGDASDVHVFRADQVGSKPGTKPATRPGGGASAATKPIGFEKDYGHVL